MGSHLVMGEKLVGEVDGVLKITAFKGLRKVNDQHNVSIYHVVCLKCGAEYDKTLSNIRANKGNGCWKCRKSAFKHGMKRSRIYNIWIKMRERCLSPQDPAYPNYGGRGIKVCEAWKDETHGFENFRDWSMEHGYSKNLSIDRINNNSDYSPQNCRWADRVTQGNNKRNNNVIEYNRESLTLQQWSNRIGVNHTTLLQRFKNGWSIEKALTTPKMKSRWDIK